MLGQPGHKTRPHALFPPIFPGMVHGWPHTYMNVAHVADVRSTGAGIKCLYCILSRAIIVHENVIWPIPAWLSERPYKICPWYIERILQKLYRIICNGIRNEGTYDNAVCGQVVIFLIYISLSWSTSSADTVYIKLSIYTYSVLLP